MDPLSIAASCIALLEIVGKTASTVTTFSRGCREARSDLTAVAGELSQLQLVLELLKHDIAVVDTQIIPESLQTQALAIIKNCSAVISAIETTIEKCSGTSGAVRWVSHAKTEVKGLRGSLEAHRASLNLVLELVAVSYSRAIKQDTAVLRTDVGHIKEDTIHIPDILDELTRLRSLLSSVDIAPAASGQNCVLQKYLNTLTTYAESVLDHGESHDEDDGDEDDGDGDEDDGDEDDDDDDDDGDDDDGPMAHNPTDSIPATQHLVTQQTKTTQERKEILYTSLMFTIYRSLA
ncbi:hypothetical protein QBC35DRAFT_440076 [Podospora australis]|uniref:Azaphilone pigments biosynthesis cluster protein L N-terminal domain-containing protein n=1 Tax=Podospora australis TaxID=1536484 RepID=A0AAN6WPL9_9PEZI|nr:hypothetical protein QBC35DRAFT_440076 [Podospora australis]